MSNRRGSHYFHAWLQVWPMYNPVAAALINQLIFQSDKQHMAQMYYLAMKGYKHQDLAWSYLVMQDMFL